MGCMVQQMYEVGQNLFRSKKLELDVAAPKVLLVCILDYKLANKVNTKTRIFKYHFKKGEECQFRADAALYAKIDNALGLGKDLSLALKKWLETGAI